MTKRFKIYDTPIRDLLVLQESKIQDARGSFTRKYCLDEFQTLELNTDWPQINISSNIKKGTLRGLHFQEDPYSEIKLVSCIKGSLIDVVIDLRTESPSFGKYFRIELKAYDQISVYIPRGCAHGYQTLEDNTELLYLSSNFYNSEFERGIKYDDPFFDLDWPLPISSISEKDSMWKPLNPYS